VSAPVTAAGCVGGGGGGGGGAAPEELDTTESWASPPAALIFNAHEHFNILDQHAEHQNGLARVGSMEGKRPNLVTPFRELRLEEVVVRKHIHTACLFVLALVASGAVLVHLRAVLVPFVLAMGLFYSLLPIVDLLSSQPNTRRSISNRGCLNTPVRKNDRVCGYDEDDYKGRADVPAHIKLVISITVWIRRCRLPRVRQGRVAVPAL
jgi:hypothetical protein